MNNNTTVTYLLTLCQRTPVTHSHQRCLTHYTHTGKYDIQ